MKKITDIKEQVKDKKRVSIFLDGEFCMGLDLITVMKLRLKIGDIVDEKKLIDALIMSETNSAFDKSLNYLSKSIKTIKEIENYLQKKGYSEEIVKIVIQKLIDYNYLNDFEYAQKLVSTYSNKMGEKMIRYKLILKGVDEKIISRALEEITNSQETAYNVALKYLKNKEINAVNLQKCYKYLLSKGFSYDDVNQVLSLLKQN